MAHVRRKFVDVHKAQGSAIADEAIRRIAELYAVEKVARGLPPDNRTAIRQAEARPVFDRLAAWLNAQLPNISGKSPLASTIRYALTRMARMHPYLDHGILELDNNTAERAMRAVAFGRKNYPFVGSQTGRKAAAIAYTLIETANSTASIPKRGLPTPSPALRTTRSNGSTSCSLGTPDNRGQAGRLPGSYPPLIRIRCPPARSISMWLSEADVGRVPEACLTISTGRKRKPTSSDPAPGLGRYLGSRSHLKIKFAFTE